MDVPRDTNPETYELQLRLYRALPPGQRAEMALRLSDEIRQVSRGGIKRRHPDYSDLELNQALTVLLYGREVAELVWPSSRVPKP